MPERVPPRPVGPDPAQVVRGRRLFAGLALTLLGAELLLLVLQVRAESVVAVRTVGRLVPEILLVVGIWRGNRIASAILGVCFALVLVVALLVLGFDVWPWSADVIIGIWGAILGAWAAVLFRSDALRAYMEHQRS